MKKNKSKKNIVLKFIAIISLVAYLVFSAMLLVLDMIPHKYLLVYFSVLTIAYLLFFIFIFVKKIKRKFKITATIFLIIFAAVFVFGIKYLNDTINFFEVINDQLLQKEVYYVMSNNETNYENISDLKNKTMGIYNSENSVKALKKIEKKVELKDSKKYKDIIEMLEDLNEGNVIDSILINESTLSLILTELKYLDLKEIYKVFIDIEKQDIVKIVDVTKKPFNIYVAGGDAYGSIENVTNTDVNMIVTVNPNKRKILLTSIPRDYYVKLPSFGENAYDKLTHAGYYGIEESIKAIENLLDIDINYYVKVNFSTIIGVIDAIDGIDIYSDYDFTTNNDAGTVYYKFNKGINHLNGEDALAFSRERQSFVDGDVQRVKNQQKVIEAIINKVTSSTSLITNYSDILNSVSESMSTNMDTKGINKFVKMQLNDMRGWSIETINLIGTDLYTTDTYTFPGIKLYVMEQNLTSVSEIKNKIKEYIQ